MSSSSIALRAAATDFDVSSAIAGSDWDEGTDATPGVGEAYGICRSGDEYGGDDTLKYHAATVIDTAMSTVLKMRFFKMIPRLS